MKPTEFVTAYLPFAREAQKAFGVPALVALAQSALETGWAASVAGYNFFGIRADKSWKGPVICITTREVLKGISQVQHGQAFRAYATPRESFLDWGRFLSTMPRYRGAFNRSGDPQSVEWAKGFARAIAAAGYATAPNYADQLCLMIDSVVRRMPKG